jgi:hypothetical protein
MQQPAYQLPRRPFPLSGGRLSCSPRPLVRIHLEGHRQPGGCKGRRYPSGRGKTRSRASSSVYRTVEKRVLRVHRSKVLLAVSTDMIVFTSQSVVPDRRALIHTAIRRGQLIAPSVGLGHPPPRWRGGARHSKLSSPRLSSSATLPKAAWVGCYR